MANELGNPLRVPTRTRAVIDYHHDETLPGKPLHIVVPGILIAAPALAMILWTLWGWLKAGTIEPDQATLWICLLAPVYIFGVWLFSYGYELYDTAKALKLTLIIVAVTVAAVILAAVFFQLLAAAAGGAGKGGSRKSGSKSGSGASSSSSSSGSSGGSWGGGGHWHTGGTGGGGGGAATSAPSTAPLPPPLPRPRPRVVICPFCKRVYAPEQTAFKCPGCSAATPEKLLKWA